MGRSLPFIRSLECYYWSRIVYVVFSWSLIFCTAMLIVRICRRYWIQWKNQKVGGGEKYSVTREGAADETQGWAGGGTGTESCQGRLQSCGHQGSAVEVRWCSKFLCRFYFRQYCLSYRWLVIQKLLRDIKCFIESNTFDGKHLTYNSWRCGCDLNQILCEFNSNIRAIIPTHFVKCEETCLPVTGRSLLTVDLYLQLINMKHVFTVCKLQKVHSETVHALKWHGTLNSCYLIICQ